jgi:quercetin dioxygenase-like cupin family protein
MTIERWDPRTSGPLSESALRQKLESRGFRVSRRSLPAGATMARPADERLRVTAVVEGLVKVSLPADSAILSPGDIVQIAAGTVFRLEVLGTAAAVCFDGVHVNDSEAVSRH